MPQIADKEAAQMMQGAPESARDMFAGFGGKASHTPGIKKMDQNKPAGDADGFK